MSRSDYWDEAVRTSFECNGIGATEEQILAVAGDMDTSHECFGMAYPGGAPDPQHNEAADDLRIKLSKAQSRIDWLESIAPLCPVCGGKNYNNWNCAWCGGKGYVK